MLVFLFSAMLQLAPTAAASSLDFSQPDPSEWAVEITGSGTFNRSDESVAIDLHEVQLHVTPEHEPWRLDSYRVCLAYNKSFTVWAKAGCSAPITVKSTLDPGETEHVPSRRLKISTDGYPPLENFWLVLELSSPPKRGRIRTIYAHSKKNLFRSGR